MSTVSDPKNKLDLTDGRQDGEWRSRYDSSAWRQIIFELLYLLILLAIVSFLAVYIGVCLTERPSQSSSVHIPFLSVALNKEIVQSFLVVLAGTTGGIIFDLKWLYHSVAKGVWSRDRVLWRLLVPVISGVVSVFLAFLIVSGLLPFVKGEAFRGTYFSLGFGFLFGYFSDNVIAALQNFAQTYIGTTKQGGEN